MKPRNIPRALCLCVLTISLCACAAEPRTTSEERPVAASATPDAPTSTDSAAATATPDAQPTPATPATPVTAEPPRVPDVRAALERTYKGTVAFDERAPVAAVGDFNGDGSEDLMVEARPAPGRAHELNDELANWIITDPLTVRPPDPRLFDPHEGVQKLVPREGRPRVEQTDALVVVIHGYKESGWRNPEALQTFLLKNVAGTGLRAEARAQARAVNASAGRRTPRLLGDILHEKLGGAQGFLYWTGAGYGWFGEKEGSGQNRPR